MYLFHYSCYKHIGYVWRCTKTNPRFKGTPPPRCETPGAPTEERARGHFLQRKNFTPDLWPCDLKINRDHLLSKGIHCTKFGKFQAYWVYRPPDQQVQNNMPFFQRGGGRVKSTIRKTRLYYSNDKTWLLIRTIRLDYESANFFTHILINLILCTQNALIGDLYTFLRWYI